MTFNVTTSIGNNVSAYQDTIIRVSFITTLDVNDPLPTNASVFIDSLNLIDINSADGSFFEKMTVPLLSDGAGQLTGFVDGRVPRDENTIVLTGSANSDAGNGTLTVPPAVPVVPSTGLKYNIFIPPVPTMQTAPKDDMTPSEDTDGIYSKQLKVKITDGADAPYKNYTIEWSPLYHADFPARFNVYDNEKATSVLTPFTNSQPGIYYYTATDDDGIATLYVVSKKNMASETLKATIIPCIERTVSSFASVSNNISDATLTLRPPELIWNDPIILNEDTPQEFLVTIKYQSEVGDEVHLFLNNKYEYTAKAISPGEPLRAFIQRTDLVSTTDPVDDPYKDNIMFYAVTQKGVVKTSARKAFQATGKIEPVEPEDVDRTLPSPYLFDDAKTINEDFIKGGIEIYIDKKDKNGDFIFKVDDTVTGKIFIKAFEPGSNRIKSALVVGQPFTVQTIDLDPNGASQHVVFIAEQSLRGFDTSSRGTLGMAKIEYVVDRPGSIRKIYSYIYICDIDTVPPIRNTI